MADEARRGRARHMFFLMMSASPRCSFTPTRCLHARRRAAAATQPPLLTLPAAAATVLIMWENTSYRMAEEQRRRNAQRRSHITPGQNGRPPRIVSNAGGVNVDTEAPGAIVSACSRHGLAARPWAQAHAESAVRRPRVFDVMLLEGPELELLEVRLHELSDTVERFILVEGQRNMHGRRKPSFFAEQRDSPRFAKYRQKLLHYVVPEEAYKQPDGREIFPSVIDRLHRTEMRAAVQLAGAEVGDVVLTGNVNEIPSATSLGLFVGCTGWPSNATTVGLLLEPFVFSFGFGLHAGAAGSGAMARISEYTEGRQAAAFSRGSIGRLESGGGGPVLLNDAGWKCTCCFAALGEYVEHCPDLLTVSRFGTAGNRRDPAIVQRVICGGKHEDPASHKLEASSAVQLRGPITAGADLVNGVMRGSNAAPPLQRQHGLGGVPSWLGQQSNDNDVAVRFLLPGKCERRPAEKKALASDKLPPGTAAPEASKPEPAAPPAVPAVPESAVTTGDPAVQAAVLANTETEKAREAKYAALRAEADAAKEVPVPVPAVPMVAPVAAAPAVAAPPVAPASAVSAPPAAPVDAPAVVAATVAVTATAAPPVAAAAPVEVTATVAAPVPPPTPPTAAVPPPPTVTETTPLTLAAVPADEAAAAAALARKALVKKGHGRDR